MRRIIISGTVIFFLMLWATTAAFAQTWEIVSPDGDLAVTVNNGTSLDYQVKLKGTTVIEDSPLGFNLKYPSVDYRTNLVFVNERNSIINETYPAFSGKKSLHVNRANEKTLSFRNSGGNEFEVIFRAYDDGMAFRYQFLGGGQLSGELRGDSEVSSFRIPNGAQAWIKDGNGEEGYGQGEIGRDYESGARGFPALFNIGGRWALITESGVPPYYFGSHLSCQGSRYFGFEGDETLRPSLPFTTPWRLAIIGENLGTIVESVLVDNLNDPLQINDPSWIKPGIAAWSWLAVEGGDSLSVQKKYVDFASEMGWAYNTVDAEWKINWDDKGHGTRFSVPDLVDYAKVRHVDIFLWFHSLSLKDQSERDYWLPLIHNWGVKGIKVDFLDGTFGIDSAGAMEFIDTLARETAENQLLVFWHGSSFPRGEQRKWPNMMSFEAVRGEEMYKAVEPPDEWQNCVLPYTRNVIGPMDYTPSWFSTPNRVTTLAHELALSVVLESGIQHLGDTPESYRSHPYAYDFLKEIDAFWDETHFINGYPGDYLSLARRKGNNWFIGTVNGGTARSLTVPLDFLGSGSYHLELYQDAPGDDIDFSSFTVTAGSQFTVNIPARGGFSAKVKPMADGLPEGDIDSDGDVDKDDVLAVLQNWLASSPNPSRADTNGDGKVNGVDFGYVVRDGGG